MSTWATGRRRGNERLQRHVADAKQAYVNGKQTRSLYLRLPKELGLGPGILGKLVRCCYGTRDAGAIWEAFYVDSLVSLGFKQGNASPCCLWHPDWRVAVVVHGDDLTALGTPSSLDKYEHGLQQCFELKLKGCLGEGPEDLTGIRLLNRTLRVTEECLKYEADPRHVELLGRAMGLSECKPISTPA